jgi:hypothetical protein
MTALEVTLYTRPGCHLCEQAEVELDRLRSRLPHTLRLVDITTQAELEQRYGERIPVISINNREYQAPLTSATVERALREAGTG